MSAIVKQTIRIGVTKGDAFPSNRIEGSSNTGTYFVSSKKDWPLFESYFIEGQKYYFDTKRIISYCASLPEVFKECCELMPDHYSSLKSYLKLFLQASLNPETKVVLRANDQRIFMKFEDNTRPLEDAFRHLLYGEISVVVLEKNDDGIAIYAEPDYGSKGPTKLPKKTSLDDLLLVEEDE